MNRTVDNKEKRNPYGRWPLWKLILAYVIVGLFVYGAAYAIFFYKRPTTDADNATQQNLSQPADDQSHSDTPPTTNGTTDSSDSTNSGGGFFNY